ncbi:MAG: hypothetical protein WD669_12275 [Pirellulales bacterium]
MKLWLSTHTRERANAALTSTFLFAVCLFTMPALADDLHPPAYRGLTRSTSAEWDFLSAPPDNNIQPDGTSVPLVIGDAAPLLDAAFNNDPHPSGSRFGGGSVNWSAMSNGGYLAGPNTSDQGLVFNVPNWIDQEPLKLLRVQITYQGPAPTTDVIGSLGVPGTTAGVVAQQVAHVPDTAGLPTGLPPGTNYFYDDWTIRPNPDWEQVVVYMSEGTFVDQVVIDTISFVPEPSSFALAWLGLFGFVALGRRVRARVIRRAG